MREGAKPIPWAPAGPPVIAGQAAMEGVTEAGFLNLARAVCARGQGVALISGGGLDCATHSILAWDPLLLLRSRGRALVLESGGRMRSWRGDPLEALDRVLEVTRPDWPLSPVPFAGGLIGYAAYELKNQIERLPQSAADDLDLPDMFWLMPGQVAVLERASGRATWLALAWPGREAEGTAPPDFAAPIPPEAAPLKVGELTSNFTHAAYLAALRRVRAYIRAGDVYQINLSQRFSFDLQGSPFALWKRLLAVNPAPFYAFVNAGGHQALSTSMERFLFRRGAYLETRPIKGTRPRGRTPAEDEALRRALAESPKDDAELSMIVDLLRNDLGRVCRRKSIRVARHKVVEGYQNVHHLVSTVTGELDPGVGPGRLLRAAFPGGSITGCPKIRAMEIIDELEPQVRHVYTGSMGYLGWHDNLDLSVAIRTAIHKEGRCHFAVGGGVVYDSDEEDEYQETLHKARTLFEVARGLG